MVKESDYLISNQEILGGLKAAVEGGETLKEAMMTFYQAGYDKYDIEDAARAYLNQQKNAAAGLDPTQRVQTNTEKEPVQKPIEKPKPSPIKKLPKVPQKKKITEQKISSYSTPKKTQPPKNNALTIILVLIFLFLIGVLAAVILFKGELVDFINRMFS